VEDVVTTVVTGATGVIGTALVAALRARGDDVVVVHRGEPLPATAGRVFHLAPARTQEVLDAYEPARVVFSSSVLVYGDHDGALTEDLDLRPLSAYARAKADDDVLARERGAVVARLSNVYGSGDRQPSRLVPELLHAIRHGHAPRLRSDGTPRRDFLHADDAAAALIALAEHGTPGEAYNIGSGAATSVREVVETLERVLQRRLGAVYDGHPDGARWADITKITGATAWRPRIGLEDGLRRLVTA
jgi:nucleoside-diphosphate-sugar epimerase